MIEAIEIDVYEEDSKKIRFLKKILGEEKFKEIQNNFKVDSEFMKQFHKVMDEYDEKSENPDVLKFVEYANIFANGKKILCFMVNPTESILETLETDFITLSFLLGCGHKIYAETK